MNIGSQNILDDLAEKTFGFLTVIDRAANDKFGTVYWNLVCRCGEKVVRRANILRAGKFFTCGKMECRFWSKVYIPETDDSLCPSSRGWCHEWTGALKDGYGVMKEPGEEKVIRAHVRAYEMKHGPLPPGMWVLHHCDNRKCVRDSHHFTGDHAANMADMAQKGRAKGLEKKYLSTVEKEQMRADYWRGGVTHPDLAARYGVSLITVGRTLRGESSQEN